MPDMIQVRLHFYKRGWFFFTSCSFFCFFFITAVVFELRKNSNNNVYKSWCNSLSFIFTIFMLLYFCLCFYVSWKFMLFSCCIFALLCVIFFIWVRGDYYIAILCIFLFPFLYVWTTKYFNIYIFILILCSILVVILGYNKFTRKKNSEEKVNTENLRDADWMPK